MEAGTNITVTYEVDTGSTAESDVDYTALTGSVVIYKGYSNGLIQVWPIDDHIDETDETVTVNLTGFSNPRLSIHATNNTDTITIQDDDHSPVVATNTGLTVEEGETEIIDNSELEITDAD
jgi:hypothetical protein